VKWNREYPQEKLFCSTDFDDFKMLEDGEVHDSSSRNGPINFDALNMDYKGR